MAKDIVIRNVDYDDVPYIDVPIQDSQDVAHFIDTSDATLSSGSQMLDGVTGYSDGVKVVGSIPNRSGSDLTASGATVTVPAGNYATQATKSVASGTATAPTSISGTSATVSTGTNTLTLSKSVSVTPRITTAGYVSSGTAGNSSVSLTASVTTKAAATITPGTTAQTIASGTYLTGTQTIAGDANLIGSRIVAPYSIFGVTGTAQLPSIVQDSTTHGLTIS